MNIKKSIKDRGFTISSVAKQLGIGQSALTQQIQANSLTLSRLERIAEICGCSLMEFLADDETDILVCPNCGSKFVKISDGVNNKS